MGQIDRFSSAAELGQGIGAGQIDPVELTEAMLEAIAAHPDSADIYARTTPDRARAEAQAAALRARHGTRRGILDGVPISWKDLYDTVGVATEGGTALLKGRVPDADAEVLANASAAGLVCLGKTHTTEFAFSGLGLNPVTGTPPNAIDPPRAPGGSSSGAAVSTALGLAAAGIGSDTGGSVRVPAVWNNLVGFKTSLGTLSTRGVLPLRARFDTVGPLCRTVEDAALLFAAMAVDQPVDLSGQGGRRRFLVLSNDCIPPIDDAPQAAFEAACDRLSRAGHVVDSAKPPGVDEAMSLTGPLFAPESWGTWGHLIAKHGDKMYPPVRKRFEGGRDVTAASFVAAWLALHRHRAEFSAATAGYDAVLLPTCPILPPLTKALLADEDYFVARNLEALRNTFVGNLLDLTGCTMPVGVDHCGLSLLCPPGQERRALVICAEVEKTLLSA